MSIGAAAALAVLVTSSSADASPQDVFGYGPRSQALGATGAAFSEGFEATYGNPALLSLSRERQLRLGTFGAVFDFEAGGRQIPYEALSGSVIGAVLPIPLGGVLEDRLALGLAFFTPFDLVVRGRLLFPETPQFPVADRTQSVTLQTALGIDLGHGIRFGGGFSALAALTGTVLVAQDASGRLGTTVEDTLVARYAPLLGASLDLGDDYRVGLTYRGALEGPFDVRIQVEDLGSLVVPELHISGMAQYDPHQVALEVARTTGPVRGAIGVTYKHWPAYPGLAEATVRCEFELNGGFEPCTAPEADDPDYGVTFVPRIGLELVHEPAEGVSVASRFGYFLEPTPAPEQTGNANVFEETKSALTWGYGLALSDPLPGLSLDFVGQLHILHGREHEKSSEAGGGSVSTRGAILAGGTTLGVSF